MQSSKGGSNYMSSSGMHMSTSAQAPVVPVRYPVSLVYPYVEGGEASFPNTTFPTFYNPDNQLCGQGGGGYFESQAGSQVTTNVVSSEVAVENFQRSSRIASHKSTQHNSHLIWLKDNLEIARDGSLSRCSLYDNYLRHCQEQNMEPLKQPSFGKLIHSVFVDLKSRRLGTRGNSKYHYYGIRVKPNSPLSKLQEDPQYMVSGQQPIHQEQRVKNCMSGGSQHSTNTPEQLETTQSQHHQQQFIKISCDLPRFPTLDHLCSQPLLRKDIKKLQTLYRNNCMVILDAVKNRQFHCIEKLWQSFWYSTSDRATAIPNSNDALEGMISRDNLVALCKYEDVRMWMRSCDSILYEAMVENLIPNVLCQVPSDLIRDIRNFAKSVEGWMTTAMRDFPQEVVCSKVEVVSAFAQMLRHYTRVNHLAQEARSQLQNTSTINNMLVDLNKVDFTNIQKQASWVCQCDESVVRRLEQNFKATLQQQSSGDQWATWLDVVVSQALKPHQENKRCVEDARQFLLKWSFYSSMVIRDLTLHSAATFGTCHLIGLFYDEYMLYLVERHVAKATKQTAITVIGEFNDLRCTT